MKKIFTLILLALLPMVANAYDAYINGIYYKFSGNEAEVTYKNTSYNSYSGDVVIPGSVTYSGKNYRVTGIGYSAFRSCGSLTSVTIPNSVTSISGSAFQYCNNLKFNEFNEALYLGNNVNPYLALINGKSTNIVNCEINEACKVIGDYAFENCYSLTSISIPNSLANIGKNAFSGCCNLTAVHISDLKVWCKIAFGNYTSNPLNYAHHLFLNGEEIKDLVIPNGVISIGDNAFHGCSGLTSVIFPNSVTSIGKDAFFGCSGLTSVTFPNSVTSIGEHAFHDCSGLTSVHISDLGAWCKIAFIKSSNPLEYAHHLFLNGVEIRDLAIPNSVTSIGGFAFSGCSGLTSVNIPNSVTSIGNGAFENCCGLTSFTIPNSMTSIGNSVFSGCSGLTSVNIPNSVTSIGDGAFSGCSGLTSIAIPGSVTSIGWGAFRDCSGLTSITIPNSVTTIDSYAFSGCNGFTSVTIPNSVTSIGDKAFDGCSGLTSVSLNSNAFVSTTWSSSKSMKSIFGDQVKIYYLGEDVKSIGQAAFWGCSSLISITIPNSVISIGWDAFRDCSGLTAVHISDLESWCKIAYSNSDSNPLAYAHHLFLNGVEIRDLVIPNSVTSIGQYAFLACSGLTSITIPNSVSTIGSSAFSGCNGLTSVNIPNSVTSIGGSAFSGCSRLISIIIPNSVTSIGDNAFYGCYFVYDSFVNNSSLSDSNNWGATLCDEETNDGLLISNTTVVKCRPWVTSATIPSNVTSIYDFAFDGCSGLTSITIPNSVTSIGRQAFSRCSGLTSITIPNSVTSIGDFAFAHCSSLTNVYCLAENVPETSSYAFGYTPMTSAKLHVPKSSVESYKTTSPWSGFGTIVALQENKGDLNGDLKIDIADAVTVLNIMAAGEYEGAADVNGDYKVDIADFVTILNIMAAGETQKPVTEIVLNETSLSLQVNETRTITATVQPTDATNRSVTWNSSNESVATVDQTGKVTAIAAGSCTITCSAIDGSGVKAECQVMVKGETASIVGTWEWREGNTYIRVTLNEDGTYTVTGFVDGGNFSGSGNYTYSDGYLILTNVDMGGDKIKVVSLTSTTLVLQNFPNEGNSTFYRK